MSNNVRRAYLGWNHSKQHDLPHKVHATLQAYSAQIYTQLSDLTPSLSQIEDSLKEIPNLVGNAASSSQQLFQQPPPPPTKVPTLMERIAERADAITGSRRRTNVVAGVALVGISAAVVSQTLWPTAARRRRHALRSAKIVNGTRREIIGESTAPSLLLCLRLQNADQSTHPYQWFSEATRPSDKRSATSCRHRASSSWPACRMSRACRTLTLSSHPRREGSSGRSSSIHLVPSHRISPPLSPRSLPAASFDGR